MKQSNHCGLKWFLLDQENMLLLMDSNQFYRILSYNFHKTVKFTFLSHPNSKGIPHWEVWIAINVDHNKTFMQPLTQPNPTPSSSLSDGQSHCLFYSFLQRSCTLQSLVHPLSDAYSRYSFYWWVNRSGFTLLQETILTQCQPENFLNWFERLWVIWFWSQLRWNISRKRILITLK